MTWLRDGAGYELFFNRDERRTRRPAAPPAPRVQGARRFLAPRDGDFGGTWIAVSDLGLSLALLNAYTDVDDESRAPPDGFRSRGLLIPSLIDADSARAVVRRLRTDHLSAFRSFLLAAFDPTGDARLAIWTAGNLSVDDELDARLPLVSSSFETRDVCESRRALFHTVDPVAHEHPRQRHLRYHASHLPQRGPRSVCMHRPDAHTVSFSQLTVDADRACFHYTPHSPCRGLITGPPTCIPRA